MDYYKTHIEEYINKTINSNMQSMYTFFEKYLPNNTKDILDVGFGSGRDSLYFSTKYFVTSIDKEEGFCEHGIKIGLKNVLNIPIEDITFNNQFDGIWACASLLHVDISNLEKSFNNCYNALRKDGVMYCSFKYGDFIGIREDRYYVDLTEKTILKYIGKFSIVDYQITEDVLNRDNKWLNAILKK